MSQIPRVSVIIPCFNLGRFIEEAVDSVREQTYGDYEILIVNDGSTDDYTRARLDSLERTGTCVIHGDNRGLSAARNVGIRNSAGRYICSLDADDRLAPTWLERAVGLLEGDAGLTFVSHWLEAFGDERWEWKPGRCDLGMLLDFNVFNGAALFKRELVDGIGGFDESMREGCEDWEFWIRVTEAGYRGAIVPEVQYQYRRRSDSMSRTMNDGDTHLRLYADLVGKHPRSYQRHLLDLVLRRERSCADLCQRIDTLEEETRWLEPALRERRLELNRAQARLEDIQARLKHENETRELAERAAWLDQERTGLIGWAEKLEAERAALAEQVARSAAEQAVTAARADQAAAERDLMAARADDAARAADGLRARVVDLQSSRSWRITSPLRRVYEWWGAVWK